MDFGGRMRRTMMPAVFLLALTVGKSGVALAESCAATTVNYLQCEFDIPEMQEGEKKAVLNNNTEYFTGAAAASCQGGALVLGKQQCQTTEPTDCAIGSGTWYSDAGDKSCGHEALDSVLHSGQEKTVSSSTNSGSITYSCEAGNLSVVDSSCPSYTAKQASTIELSGSVMNATEGGGSQTVYVETYFTYPSKITNMSNATIQVQAELACGNLAGSDIASSQYTVAYNGYNSTREEHDYLVQCPFTRTDLDCDEFLVSDSLTGRYNSANGEYSLAPAASDIAEMCQLYGGTGVEETIYMRNQRYPAGVVVDEFDVVARCKGKQSACSTQQVSQPDATLGQVINCDTAYASTSNTGYIAVEAGQFVTTQQVQDNICGPLGFDNVQQILDTNERMPGSGDVEYYAVEAICTTYQWRDSKPLAPACTTEDTAVNSNTQIKSCDAATVEGSVRQSIYESQGEALIQSRLCVQNSYETLDSYAIVGGGSDGGGAREGTGVLFVEAQCSGYVGSEIIAGCGNNQCMGEEVGPDSLYSTIEVDGKYYRDLCSTETLLSCQNCDAGSFTFTDSVTGNTCMIDVGETFSGQESHFEFSDSSINGSVDMLCNDGVKSVVPGGDSVCYKTCPGNVTVGWEDSNGTKSCANTIPAGSYVHDQTVSLGSSITNTGNATFRCDGYTGNWVKQSGSCQLDCNTSAAWGSGTSNSGENKTNLCRANPGRVPHGATGNLSSNTTNTSGSATYTCNNGDLEVNGNSCNMDCTRQGVNWGAYCGTTAPARDHTRTLTANHTYVTSYQYDSSISGTATFQCDDGVLKERSASCTYITGTRNGAWSAWVETARQCTKSPDSDDFQPDESFTQTTSCTIDFRRPRLKYYVWNDGSETAYDTEYDYKTEIETSQQSVSGTGEPVRDYIGSEWGTWGSWSEYNKICYTTTCTRYLERYRYRYDLYDMAPTRVRTSTRQRDTKTESVSAPRTMTSEGWAEWKTWQQDGSPDCYRIGNERVCETAYERERCWLRNYNLAPRTELDCSRKQVETKTETTRETVDVPTELRWVLTGSSCRQSVAPSDSSLTRSSSFQGNIGPSCSTEGDTAGLTNYHPYDLKGCGGMASYNSEFQCMAVPVSDSSKYKWVYNNHPDVSGLADSVICMAVDDAYGSSSFDIVGDMVTPSASNGSPDDHAGVCSSLGASGRVHMNIQCQIPGASSNSDEVSVTAYFSIGYKITNTNSATIQTEAEMACSGVSGSDLYVSNYSVSFKGYSNGMYNYSVACPFSRDDLGCTEFLVAGEVSGEYNPALGEFTRPPSQSRIEQVCTDAGGTHKEKLYVSNARGVNSRVADSFDVVSICSNGPNMCSSSSGEMFLKSECSMIPSDL